MIDGRNVAPGGYVPAAFTRVRGNAAAPQTVVFAPPGIQWRLLDVCFQYEGSAAPGVAKPSAAWKVGTLDDDDKFLSAVVIPGDLTVGTLYSVKRDGLTWATWVTAARNDDNRLLSPGDCLTFTQAAGGTWTGFYQVFFFIVPAETPLHATTR